jgi:DNA-binding CsgD family transcriptional regulator
VAWWGVAVAARGAATGAITQVVLRETPRPVHYVVSGTFAVALAGIVLLFIPDVVHHGLFQFLLLPVLLAGFTFGLAAGLLALGLGLLATLIWLIAIGLSPFADGPLPAQWLLFAGEGAATALLSSFVRTALRQPAVRLLLSPMATTGPPTLVEPLTSREIEVLELAASGLSVDQLGARLFVSPNTVKSHLAHAYNKLGAHSRAQAIAAGLRTGVLNETIVEAASGISQSVSSKSKVKKNASDPKVDAQAGE